MKKVLKTNGKVLPVGDYWPIGDVFVMNDERTESTIVGKVVKVADYNDIPEFVMIGYDRVTRMEVIQDIALLGRLGMPSDSSQHPCETSCPRLPRNRQSRSLKTSSDSTT